MRFRAHSVAMIGVASCAAVSIASCLDFGSLSGDAGVADDASITSDDAAVGSDATSTSTDGGDGGDAASSGFCARNPGHTLCDDFDESDYLAAWSLPIFVTADATITQDPTLSVSAPSSLAAETVSGDASSFAYVQTKLASIPTTLHIEFDFELAGGGGSTVTIANVTLPNNFQYVLKLASPNPPAFEIVEVSRDDGGVTDYHTLPSVAYPVQTGRFYHVVLDFALRGTDAGEVDVTFDDAGSVTDQAPVAFSFNPSGSVQLQAGVGSFSAAPYLGASIRLDNYVVDLK